MGVSGKSDVRKRNKMIRMNDWELEILTRCAKHSNKDARWPDGRGLDSNFLRWLIREYANDHGLMELGE